MSTDMEIQEDVPRAIATLMVRELRRILELDEDSCYLAAAPIPVEGMPQNHVIQVCPADSKPWEEGEGGQEGGNLFREQTYTVACWFFLLQDQNGYTQEALQDAAYGILNYTEKLRCILTGADFGIAQQIEPMKYQSESSTQLIEDEPGRLFRSLTFSVPYAMPFITDLTIGLGKGPQ